MPKVRENKKLLVKLKKFKVKKGKLKAFIYTLWIEDKYKQERNKRQNKNVQYMHRITRTISVLNACT